MPFSSRISQLVSLYTEYETNSLLDLMMCFSFFLSIAKIRYRLHSYWTLEGVKSTYVIKRAVRRRRRRRKFSSDLGKISLYHSLNYAYPETKKSSASTMPSLPIQEDSNVDTKLPQNVLLMHYHDQISLSYK